MESLSVDHGAEYTDFMEKSKGGVRDFFAKKPELAALTFAVGLFVFLYVPAVIAISLPSALNELSEFFGKFPPIVASLLGGVTVGVWGFLAFPGILLITILNLYFPGLITASSSAFQTFSLISLVSSIFWACLVYGIELLAKRRVLTKKGKKGTE